MKLIDLLVRELPKHGGWPESYTTQLDIFIKKEKLVFIVNSKYSYFEDWDGNRVERDQYQSALAASQRVEWSGDGLPPVGCECEARYREADGAEWFFFRCVGVDCGVALVGLERMRLLLVKVVMNSAQSAQKRTGSAMRLSIH